MVSFFAIIALNIMSDQDGMNMCLNSMQWPKKLLKPGCYQGKLGMGLNVSVRNRQMQDSSMPYALIKRNEQAMRANSMAKKLQQNNAYDFWKEVKVINNSKVPLPSSIAGITGSKNIAELWRNIIVTFLIVLRVRN